MEGYDEAKWLIPSKVSDIDRTFGNVKGLMPPMEEIPAPYRTNSYDRTSRKEPDLWIRFQFDWFYHGFEKLDLTPKEGIDLKTALSHLATIQGSYEPKHQHKIAAVAYLASLWFKDVKYVCSKKKN